MKNIIAILLSFCFVSSVSAKVQLITSDVSSTQNRGAALSVTYTANQAKAACKDAGYETTTCTGGEVPRIVCPYADSYFKGCCDPIYNYVKSYCYEQDMTPSTTDCLGLHYCIDKDQH